jgi:hypothetical protein
MNLPRVAHYQALCFSFKTPEQTAQPLLSPSEVSILNVYQLFCDSRNAIVVSRNADPKQLCPCECPIADSEFSMRKPLEIMEILNEAFHIKEPTGFLLLEQLHGVFKQELFAP